MDMLPDVAMEAPRPPVPPFTLESAILKVRKAEDAWNTQNPPTVALAYTPDSKWRNRSEFIVGRDQIVTFLTRKWAIEHDYRLIKELWGFRENRMAVRFCYEWHDSSGNWFRSHGNELWSFAPDGRMQERHASINDVLIRHNDRKFLFARGARPADHPGLTELGL
jgi:nuclear transport factor 2 (NTF2) superfamily protein